ncbi:thiamine pyrophosphate-binding protein [Actinobacteria bacterium YIM 96077]|uniref:Thiamine pyrophosphate-binding protein n=1 Tax=Phytoactinopolyspora halophila TaxID=1981511 RepID=A0A329QPJ1_9ACTN|nr:thiamine pyrophosphate-binding protein [Phytoactinopolyspora halophila]AYY12282.1 thiamine pyrophosphate-binding protein [Actinobacteria bacterium YIM 96077]RAW13801.1 hypothetical protein DPM12_12420 [Phytoactinopolyspora halophila]
MSTAADEIVATLAAAGVRTVFGVVGTSTLDLADAIARDPRMEFVSAREEEAAAHMADGYARATSRLGVTLAHVGPGALRQMYGVGTAWKDSVPLLVLTGNEMLPATDLELREGYHVVDVLELYRPITKATMQLREAADASHAVTRAMWTAASGRPGPVLLDLPKNVLKQQSMRASATPVTDTVPAARIAAHPAEVRAAAQHIITAERPIIVAGGGTHWAGAHESLASLATNHDLPVVTTDGGRGSIPEDHAHALGVVARQAGDAVAQKALANADVILVVGAPLSDVSTFEWSAWPDTSTVIRVDVGPESGYKGIPAQHHVVADAGEFVVALDTELRERDHHRAGDWHELRAQLEEERRACRQPGQGELERADPWTVIDELETALPRDAFISVDSGMHSFFGKKLRVLAPRSYIRSAGFGAMGYSYPAVLGAVEGDPERRGVAIVGDGCLAMCLGELETAARRGSRVTVIVYNDARFASQQSHQHRRFGGRVIGTDFRDTGFAEIARAQGVPGWTVADDAGARQAVREALALDGPSLIDVRVDLSVHPPTWIEGSGDARIGETGEER